MKTIRARILGSFAMLLVMLCALPAFPQRVTSDILGTVTDPSGAVVANAKVIVIGLETAERHETTTSDVGSYRLIGLNAGHYKIQIESPGFQPGMLESVELQVNQQAILNLSLKIGALQDSVTVVGEASLLDAATPGLSAVVALESLQNLPLNGLDPSQLMLLQPGVVPVTSAGPNLFTEGGTSKVSVQGARPSMNNYTMDGADINDPAYNTPPTGVAGVQLGVAAIREYRVQLFNHGAEFGRNSGANVQYITNSGGNDYHGSLFEYFRNSALDARNFFDQGKIPPFSRNQFGGTIGGPVFRNKTFFFVNVESLQERKTVNSTPFVPDADARRGFLPSAANPSSLVNVGIDPRIAPFLDLYPAGTSPIGGGLALLQASQHQTTSEYYSLLRVDHLLSPKDRLTGRYVIDDSQSTVPFANTTVPGFPSHRDIRNQFLMINWQSSVKGNLWNEAKFDFSRIYLSTREAYASPISISLSPNRALGGINVTGLSQLGSSLLSPVSGPSNTYQAIDNVSYKHSDHVIKFGADLKRIQVNGKFDSLVNGSYIFSDLTSLGVPAQSANPALEFFLKGAPLLYLGVDPALADSNRGYRQNYAGLYFQDDWSIGRGWTLNLGVRWEYWSNPTESNGRLANIHDLSTDSQTTTGPLWSSVPHNLWSPRLGFAWIPFKSSKTVLRGGFGVMRDQIWANLYSTTRFYEPYYRALQYFLPTFQAPPQNTASLIGFGGPPSVLGIFGITYHPDFPYYLQYDANVQRELPGHFRLQLSYAGSRGIHLMRSGEANPFSVPLNRRLNPKFGSTIQIVTDGQSTYNSGQLSLERRFSGGLSTAVSYTLSNSTDDQSGMLPSDYSSDAGLSQNFYNRTGDRARSAFERKHALAWNYLYDLPIGKGRNDIGGWSIGGVLSLLTGPPFSANLGSFNNSLTQAITSADRPNLKPNVNPCKSSTGDPNSYFDPTIFSLPAPGQFGNAGRNIMCGPSLMNFDFSLSKTLTIKKQARLQFRAEFFNMFNHTNFDVPINTQGPSGSGGNGDAIFIGRKAGSCDPTTDPLGCGVLQPGVAKIFRTSTASRQIQFALKLMF